MKAVYLTLLALTLFFSCSKEPMKDLPLCLDSVLDKFDMKPYDGEESYCFSLQWYIYDNKDYFYDDCCICDKDFSPFDCKGEKLFYPYGVLDTLTTIAFAMRSNYKGVIGIMK